MALYFKQNGNCKALIIIISCSINLLGKNIIVRVFFSVHILPSPVSQQRDPGKRETHFFYLSRLSLSNVEYSPTHDLCKASYL